MTMLLAIALFGAGCGGFNGSKSFSPLDLLLMKASPPSTNSLPAVHLENSTNLASSR